MLSDLAVSVKVKTLHECPLVCASNHDVKLLKAIAQFGEGNNAVVIAVKFLNEMFAVIFHRRKRLSAILQLLNNLLN